MEIYVDDEAKLTLHGLVQVSSCFFVDIGLMLLLVIAVSTGLYRSICMYLLYATVLTLFFILQSREGVLTKENTCMQHYIKLGEVEKNRKLNDLLDALDFNQVVIFVKSVSRAAELNKLLVECNFPSICIHSGMSQEER